MSKNINRFERTNGILSVVDEFPYLHIIKCVIVNDGLSSSQIVFSVGKSIDEYAFEVSLRIYDDGDFSFDLMESRSFEIVVPIRLETDEELKKALSYTNKIGEMFSKINYTGSFEGDDKIIKKMMKKYKDIYVSKEKIRSNKYKKKIVRFGLKRYDDYVSIAEFISNGYAYLFVYLKGVEYGLKGNEDIIDKILDATKKLLRLKK